MDFLAGVEGRLDRWFRRLLVPRRDQEGVQPVEIAKEIVRAMEGMRQVSVEAVYVPNHFRVRLHPVDHQWLVPVQRTVRRDCIAHAERTARRRGLSFAGPVDLELIADEAVPRGEVRVEAAYREEPRDSGTPVSEDGATRRVARVENREHEPVNGPGEQAKTRLFPGLKQELLDATASLVVVGDRTEERGLLLVPGRAYTVGRGEENDLRLNDARVSRRHARLVFEGGSWWIEDLQTTNGTLKNGVALRRERLQDGDELAMGLTVLRFEERAARR